MVSQTLHCAPTEAHKLPPDTGAATLAVIRLLEIELDVLHADGRRGVIEVLFDPAERTIHVPQSAAQGTAAREVRSR